MDSEKFFKEGYALCFVVVKVQEGWEVEIEAKEMAGQPSGP